MNSEATELATILLSKDGAVAVIELNRPRKRNALSQDLIDDLTGALRRLNEDATIRAAIVTSVKNSPFCAGADLDEMANLSTAEAFRIGWLKDLESGFATFRKPIIAAVHGYAVGAYSFGSDQIEQFGGGFEIALMCDMIVAAADARFGFPEIKLGTIPGAGGTQRLTKAVGKQKAMELILTGSPIAASALERSGIVNKIIGIEEDVVKEALKVAQVVAAFSAPAVCMAKQAIRAEYTTLDAGLEIERALYYASFSHADCQEGIAAFLQKRAPCVEHC